jgi:hypothetical protein
MTSEANPGAIQLSAGLRMKTALWMAIAADLLQVVAFPLFLPGAASPADDVVDTVMCSVLTLLVGWHWEFAPSFLAKLVPGLDLVPLWTLAIANVYRKEKQLAAAQLRQTAQQQ